MENDEDGAEQEEAQGATEQQAGAEEHRKPLGWRDLPGVVNLKDFAQMVGTEAEQIAGSFRRALESFFRLPFGPIRGSFGLLIVSVRTCLLVMVIFVFGTGIFLMTIMRALGLITRGRSSKD